MARSVAMAVGRGNRAGRPGKSSMGGSVGTCSIIDGVDGATAADDDDGSSLLLLTTASASLTAGMAESFMMAMADGIRRAMIALSLTSNEAGERAYRNQLSIATY